MGMQPIRLLCSFVLVSAVFSIAVYPQQQMSPADMEAQRKHQQEQQAQQQAAEAAASNQTWQTITDKVKNKQSLTPEEKNFLRIQVAQAKDLAKQVASQGGYIVGYRDETSQYLDPQSNSIGTMHHQVPIYQQPKQERYIEVLALEAALAEQESRTAPATGTVANAKDGVEKTRLCLQHQKQNESAMVQDQECNGYHQVQIENADGIGMGVSKTSLQDATNVAMEAIAASKKSAKFEVVGGNERYGIGAPLVYKQTLLN